MTIPEQAAMAREVAWFRLYFGRLPDTYANKRQSRWFYNWYRRRSIG